MVWGLDCRTHGQAGTVLGLLSTVGTSVPDPVTYSQHLVKHHVDKTDLVADIYTSDTGEEEDTVKVTVGIVTVQTSGTVSVCVALVAVLYGLAASCIWVEGESQP